MIIDRRKLKTGIAMLLAAAAASLVTAGCARTAETEPAETAPLEIGTVITETGADEHSSIVRGAVDGDLLPTLSEYTTAADNAVLAPAYLKPGDEHRVVLILQERLMGLGYMDNDEPTKYYGGSTAEAVKIFQRQQGMTQDGITGPETWDRIFAADAPYYQVKKDDRGEDIARIQQRLYQLGYLTESSMTGYFGDTTEAAVKKLQDRNGLTSDGTVGKQTYNLLYSDEVKANLITIGEQSELVLKYQKRLYELGYLDSQPDGTFGVSTQKAIREFQSRNDQIVDGYLGPDTRAAMENPGAKPFGYRLGDRSDTVSYIQQRLAHYNYLSSSHVTGYYGELTEAAVRAFQRYNSLETDGTVGRLTIAKLRSDSANKKPANISVTTAAGGGGSSGGSSYSVGTGGATVSGSASGLISIAYSKLGCSYVWGSKGPNSFDCSGFVYYCLNQAGVNQSYLTSSGWRDPGRYQRVSSFDSIRAGDIVVVSGHVGIAAGDGTVIDASSSNGRVVHRSLSSWWRRNFIVAWRIFG